MKAPSNLTHNKAQKESLLLMILLDQEIRTISGMFYSAVRALLTWVLLYSKFNPDQAVISNSVDSEIKSWH